MEINITKFYREATPNDYSASVAEIGNNAGPDTWRAANDDSAEYFILDTDEKREAFRDYIRGFGAWDESEITGFSDTALNALCIQFVAGDLREHGLDSESGGTCFTGTDGEFYFYCGS